ncbi:hypothetical protein ACLQ25_05365 [Micromonospora sp. DT44]|uniref:hypothetical protein n=1 Tax=Micromonospora sp. DT44 TaxID=3393439 RepID=UPI003CF1E7AE
MDELQLQQNSRTQNETQGSISERRLEEGHSVPADEASQDPESDLGRAALRMRLARALRDDETLIHAFYSVGLTADAVGRGVVSRASILTGAALIAGIDGALKLAIPAAGQWDNWSAGRSVELGTLARGTLDSARFFLQIGAPAQTLASISNDSDPLLLRLMRVEARKAGYYAWATSATNFGSFGWSVLDRFSASCGTGATVLQRGWGALRDAIMDPADRTKLVDGLASLADGLGRWHQNQYAIIGATATQLGHYAIEEVAHEWTRSGNSYERFCLAVAKTVMYGAFTGTTGRTWSSVDQGLSDDRTLVVHRDGLRTSSYLSAVAATAAAAVSVTKAASVWSRPAAEPSPAVDLASIASAAHIGTSRAASPSQETSSPGQETLRLPVPVQARESGRVR